MSALGRVVRSGVGRRRVQTLVIGLATMTLGGYLAASIRSAAATVLAAIVFTVVVLLIVITSEPVPAWYSIGFLLGGPLASLAGGTWRRTLSRS